MNAALQLLDRLLSGKPLSGDDLVALLLITTMLLSSGHLLTMLITRWGDRHIAVKSLAASLLIHGVCLLGLEIFDPLAIARAETREFRSDPAEVVTQVLIQSDQDILLPESGNTPLADRISQPDLPLTRLETPSPEIAPRDIPEPIPDELESLNTTARDVTQFELRNAIELSMAADAGEVGPVQAAVEDPQADLKTAFDRSLADVPVPVQERTRPQTGTPDQPREPLPAAEPATTARELSFEPKPRDVTVEMATSEPGKDAIVVPQASLDEADSLTRRAAPSTSPTPSEDTGLAMLTPDRRPGPASTFQQRLPRPARALPDREPAPQPFRESPQIARTPIPLSSSYDDVRVGLMAPEFSQAITSGAAVVDNELPTIQRRENAPATYRLRNVEQRRETAQRFGGTQKSETAVETSLRWLAAIQSPDGRWDASDHGAGQVRIDENGVDREFAGREADTGVTALITLCFLGAGYTHEEGRYSVAVDNALDWLIRQQAADGSLYGSAEYFARMYCHAMATYALAEAYGMQKQTLLGPLIAPELISSPVVVSSRAAALLSNTVLPDPMHLVVAQHGLNDVLSEKIAWSLRKVDDLRLRGALARAVTFTISQQDPRSGGWRYRFGQEGDVSLFGWHMMSLRSAEIAGVSLDPQIRERMNRFLNSVRQGSSGGLFGYRRNTLVSGQDTEPATPVMTAEALFCQQMLGYPRESDSSRESIGFLLQNLPRMSELNYYYWYYGTLAMYQYGGTPWDDWNSAVRDTLIELQRTDGALAGSWDPSDPWGRYGGRLYSTALATLTLEVYYRLLPLYRMNEVPAVKSGN
jgi:hypothetical protein